MDLCKGISFCAWWKKKKETHPFQKLKIQLCHLCLSGEEGIAAHSYELLKHLVLGFLTAATVCFTFVNTNFRHCYIKHPASTLAVNDIGKQYL